MLLQYTMHMTSNQFMAYPLELDHALAVIPYSSTCQPCCTLGRRSLLHIVRSVAKAIRAILQDNLYRFDHTLRQRAMPPQRQTAPGSSAAACSRGSPASSSIPGQMQLSSCPAPGRQDQGVLSMHTSYISNHLQLQPPSQDCTGSHSGQCHADMLHTPECCQQACISCICIRRALPVTPGCCQSC